MHTLSDKKVLLLRPAEILSYRENPRKHFDEYGLHALASSLISNGMLEPVCVRRKDKNKYILISGERRLRAAKIAGLRRIPCIVHEADEKNAAIFSLAANLNRENISCFDQAQAINRLIGAYGMPVSDLSQQLGMSSSALLNKLKLLRIPADKRDRIISAGLTEDHINLIAGLSQNNLTPVMNAVISEALNIKQTKELIHSISTPVCTDQPPSPPVRKSAIGDIKLFSNSLTKLLITLQNSGIRTSLERKEESGFIEYTIRIANREEKQLSFLEL
ncbi:MAG: ParB/RepB/Spo0J family partition protein [Clostridia bacterium]|nr:ParB/RepB/Spo0J family partition protein [Clostridia bacterium]